MKEIRVKDMKDMYEDKKRGMSYGKMESKYGMNKGTMFRILEGYEAGLKAGKVYGFSIIDILIGIGIGVMLASIITMIVQ